MRGHLRLHIDGDCASIDSFPIQPGDLPRHAGDRPAGRTGPIAGMGTHRQDGLAERVPNIPTISSATPPRLPMNAPRGGDQGGGSASCRTVPMRSRCTQCRRRSYRSGINSADLRDHREIGQADPSASDRTREMADYRSETNPSTRLQRDRLAIRDRRAARSPRVLRDHSGPLPRSESDLTSKSRGIIPYSKAGSRTVGTSWAHARLMRTIRCC